MAAEAARTLEYTESYFYGSAAPAREPYAEPAPRPIATPLPQERLRQREDAFDAEAAQKAPAISLFAVFGAVFAGILMIFVMLAQINFNAIAAETVRLNTQLGELMEQERKLSIQFESVIDMKEVERYAKDVLGMSKPDADQVAVIHAVRFDRAEIIDSGGDESALNGFGSFISSLMEYFKR